MPTWRRGFSGAIFAAVFTMVHWKRATARFGIFSIENKEKKQEHPETTFWGHLPFLRGESVPPTLDLGHFLDLLLLFFHFVFFEIS